jgi:hypothetical protein
MAKKAATNPAPEPVVSEAPETEATTSAAMDQPAVSVDASASSSPDLPEPASDPTSKDKASEEGATEAPSSPAEPAIVEPATPSPVEEPAAGGGFNSPFVEPPAALTMVQRIELLEVRLAALEAK